MAENKNPKPTNVERTVQPENLRIIFSTLLAYIDTVVTFRFTTLGFFLAAVALILGGTPSLEKYLLLAFITISLYLIELKNRFLKNDLEAQAKQIEKIWGYTYNKNDDSRPYPTKVFGITIPQKVFGIPAESVIKHSIGLDILYFSIFIYALIHVITVHSLKTF